MQKTSKRVLAVLLALVMTLSVFSISVVSASAENTNYRPDYQSETHTVFKHTEQTLAPGIEYYNNYAYANDGKQMVYYVTTADVTRDDVLVQVAYKDMQCDNYGMSKLSQMVATANAKYSDPDNASLNEYEKTAYANPNYSVVSATNGDGYNMTTGEPGGTLIMGGKIKKEWTKNASSDMFFAILKDGRAVIGDTKAEWDAYKADPGIAEAIDSFGGSARLVWDGVDTTASASGSYNTDRHSRTMLGVTEDGKVVTAVLDGRQEPFSCGGSMHELAQIMLEAGCVRAFNCDGGGSTTFMARMPGEDTPSIVNRPSDGSERSISNGIIIATTAKVKDEVASVVYSPETEYTTPGSKVKIGYVAYDEDNAPITRPNGLTFETTGGTFEKGVFTAPATAGDVTITAKFDGNNVGEQVIHVVVPDSVSIDTHASKVYIELGTSTPIPVVATYNGGDVTLKPEDFEFSVINTTEGYEGEAIGSFDGYRFVAPEKTEANIERYKSATLTISAKGGDASVTMPVSFEETKIVAQGFEKTGMSSISSAYSSDKQHEMASNFYATRETGKVKSGDYSMAINIDYTQINAVGYLGDNQYMTTVNKPDAQRVGMWVYIPENVPGLWIRGNGTVATNFVPTGETYKEKYDTGAWHYFEADISGYSTFAVSSLTLFISDRDGVDAGYYFKNATNVNNKFTIYIDDLTYDRTFGGHDFYEPVFGDITAYAASGAAGVDLVRGSAVDVNASTVSIVANVEDDTERNPYTVAGLDYSSAKAFIDGVAVSYKAANNTITIENAPLSKGVHTVRFEIADNNGTEAVIERQLNVTAGSNSALKLVSRTAVDTKVLIGSVHWFDLIADDISVIDSATVTLDLDGFNNWQYNRIQCADGFSYSYSIDDELNTLTLNFTRTEGTPANNTLASIPVKVWESTLTTYSGYETCTPENLFSRKIFWPISIEIKPVLGSVTLADGSKDSFSFEKFLIDTEIDGAYAKLLEEGYFADGKTSWHQHTLEWIEEPHDATCNHYGTTGIARCTVCDEIVYYDDSRVFSDHHYEWNPAKQKYVCVDCEHETDELPTIAPEKTATAVMSDGVIDNGWVVTKDENDQYTYYYVVDGKKVYNDPIEAEMYDGSGTYMLNFNYAVPCDLAGKYTGAINASNYKCKVYDNGILSTGTGDHLVTDGAKIWIVNKDGFTAYTGTTYGFYVFEGKTYCVYGAKTSTSHGTLNGGLWTGPLNYSKNTTATTNEYYLRGVQMTGWTCAGGAAKDADGNLVTGWRNADGTPAVVDKDDPDSIVGKYYFGTDGKLTVGAALVYFDDEKTYENSRYITFGTKAAYLDNIGECKGFSETESIVDNHSYSNGFPNPVSKFQFSGNYYTYMIIDGVKQLPPQANAYPIKFVDGYYYNVKHKTSGYVVSQYKPTSNYFGIGSSYNNGADPIWLEARYTGVIDNDEESGYAIFGEFFEGYTLTDGKVCDTNGAPINRWFVNCFGSNVYYKDGAMVTEGNFEADNKVYYIADEYGKALPYNGSYNNKYYIDGVASDSEIYAGDYIISDGKVCYINDDGSIGDPVTGVIGDTYFVDGAANDYQILNKNLLKDGDKLYNIENNLKGSAFSGIYNGVYYADGSATEYTVIDDTYVVNDKYYIVADDGSLVTFNGLLDGVYYENGSATDYEVIEGKYVFKDGILYNIGTDGKLSSRVTGTAGGTKYVLGVPQNGWVANTYYYVDGKKVTGAIEIDGKAYKFNDDGELEGPYNGMLYDEANDVYRMYDQGNRKNGSDEFGTCVDGVPADGWYANEYYFVSGKYLTGIQQVEGYYYDFGEDGSGSSYNKFTGVFQKDGKYYYAQLGVLTSGWTQIDDEWYYFDAKTMNPVATLNNGKVTFEFEENGKLVSGKWYITSAGRRYFYGPSYYKHGWETIGGDEYYFGDANKNPGYCYTGKRYVINSNSYTPQWYDFGEEGKAVKLTTTGLLTTDAGTYYLVDGVSQGGLQKVGEKYYYFTGTYEAKSGLVNVSAAKNNDLLPAGYYLFGDDYAMVDGAFAEWKGAQRWIVLGQPYFAGVMEDENGIYYIGSDALQKTGLVTVSNGKGNGILDDGTYMFGEDGYLTDNAFGYWQGKYVYFQDGQPYAAGPVEVAGKKYYIRSDCQPAKGLYHVSTKKANDILGEGYYLFDTETGAMVDGTFADWKGTEMYIKEGQPYFAGVVEHEGALVYVDSSCQRKTGVVHITTKTGNGILDEGYYLFDENGLVDNAFGEWTNGKTYYFVNGQRTAAGVVRVDDKIYFINGNCQAATGTVNVTAAKGNGILEAGTYTFGADGVLVAE